MTQRLNDHKKSNSSGNSGNCTLSSNAFPWVEYTFGLFGYNAKTITLTSITLPLGSGSKIDLQFASCNPGPETQIWNFIPTSYGGSQISMSGSDFIIDGNSADSSVSGGEVNSAVAVPTNGAATSG